jgi:hypothetical protein
MGKQGERFLSGLFGYRAVTIIIVFSLRFSGGGFGKKVKSASPGSAVVREFLKSSAFS